MTKPSTRASLLAIFLALILGRLPARAADALPSGARILDPAFLAEGEREPVISPDGQHVAYVSRGFVTIARVDGSEAVRVVEVKNSPSHLAARREENAARGIGEELPVASQRIEDLQWTHGSDAIVFTILRFEPEPRATIADVWLAPLEGEHKRLLRIGDDSPDTMLIPTAGIVTRDLKYLVVRRHHPRPLIWNLTTGKPQATPYLCMTPSSTSGRWIAVEKDSRELVILDESFKVAQRCEEFFPPTRHGELIWSPDERFVIWRNMIGFDYYSDWEGYRLDLRTRERRVLTGLGWEETIAFTGRQGEFLRAATNLCRGPDSGSWEMASFVVMVPHGAGFPRQLTTTFRNPYNPSAASRFIGGAPPVYWSNDFEDFVIGIPREKDPIGFDLYWTNRERRLWRLSTPSNGAYISPFPVVGFADGGQLIVAHNDSQLFAIPRAASQSDQNKVR